jgi:molybdenum cofactor cytidylyltransferase
LNTGVVILAAGFSSRMGSQKAMLPYSRSKTFVEQIAETYIEWGCTPVTIVINKELDRSHAICSLREKCHLILNDKPEAGRFYSVQLGLSSCNETDYCFIQNVDNPFTEVKTLDLLFKYRKNDYYNVPVYSRQGGHPILIPRKIIDRLFQFHPTETNLKEILAEFPTQRVKVHSNSILININSPEDYQSYFSF